MSGPDLLVLAPLRIEAAAVRRGLATTGRAGWSVRRTGMGPRRSRAAATALGLAARPEVPVAVAGFCGALDPRLRVGDVVVASRLDGPTGSRTCPGTEPLLGSLRRRGLAPRHAAVATVSRPVVGRRRAAAAEGGAVAVDMESVWLAQDPDGHPFAVLRVVLDAPGAELLRPALPAALRTAGRALAEAAPALLDWADACRADAPRTPTNPPEG